MDGQVPRDGKRLVHEHPGLEGSMGHLCNVPFTQVVHCPGQGRHRLATIVGRAGPKGHRELLRLWQEGDDGRPSETACRCEVHQQNEDEVHGFGECVPVEPVFELDMEVPVKGKLHRAWLYDSVQQEPKVHRFRVRA